MNQTLNFRPQGVFAHLSMKFPVLNIFFQQPENILLHFPGPYPRIQIADFGLARPRGYQETLNVCGTISYLPPEGILALDNKHLGYVGMAADCWSAGVILFIMLSCVFLTTTSITNR
jgi:meiosis-specific serine/threonine-protein kinase MEK1